MNNKEKLTEATVQALQNKLTKNNTDKICKIQESENTFITQISSEIISKLEDEIELTYGWEYNEDDMCISGTLDDDYEIDISILQNNNKITYEYNGNVYSDQDDCIKAVLEDCKNYIRNVLKEYDEYPNYVEYFSDEDDDDWDESKLNPDIVNVASVMGIDVKDIKYPKIMSRLLDEYPNEDFTKIARKYEDEEEDADNYIYYSNDKDNIEGWLYGAVQAANGKFNKLKNKNENVNKSILNEETSNSYTAISYYDDKLKGVEDETSSGDWSVITDFAHDKLMSGSYVKITNTTTGKEKVISPDTYQDDFDGEFVIGIEELDESVGDKSQEETLNEAIKRAHEEEISAINTYDTVLSKTDESTDAKLIEMINEIKKDEEDHKSLLKHYIETGEALTDDELEELKNSKETNEDDSEDIEVERTIEIDDEDDSECPYLVGYSSTDLDIEDRGDLTEDELFVTGWTGIVHNVEEGPFESFNEMQIDCYDDEKGGEYDLPDIPEDIQKKFLQRVNNWIKENN